MVTGKVQLMTEYFSLLGFSLFVNSLDGKAASRPAKASQLYAGLEDTGVWTPMHPSQPRLHRYPLRPAPTKLGSYWVTGFAIWN